MGFDEPRITILLAIGNNILAEGVRCILVNDPEFRVRSAHRSAPTLTPDLILFDANQNLRTLAASYPEAKLVLLDTGLKEQEITYLLLCHQVNGIIAPDVGVELFHKALKVVHGGEIWIAQEQLKSLLRSGGAISNNGDVKGLSQQDQQIVQLIAQGYRNREIGAKLCLSEHTIKAHVSRIYRRLNINSRTQLVSLVMETDQGSGGALKQART